jgi:hypothetical protein
MEIVIKYFKSFVCQVWGTRSSDNVLSFTWHDPLQDGIGYHRLRLRNEFQVLTETLPPPMSFVSQPPPSALAISTVHEYKPKKIHLSWGGTYRTVGSTSPSSLYIVVHHRIHRNRYELNTWAAGPDGISLHHLLLDLNISLPHALSERLSHITPWHVMQTTCYFQTRKRWNVCP